MTPVLEKFISAFPKTDILLVSSADRAFRYNGEYQTAKGLPNLIETQAKLAYDHHLAFFNLFETMAHYLMARKTAFIQQRLYTS